MNRLTWTVLPTKPGWYFWRPDANTNRLLRDWLPKEAGIYRLEMTGLSGDEKLHLALPKDRNRYPAEWMAGYWAGPIPEPEDPQTASEE